MRSGASYYYIYTKHFLCNLQTCIKMSDSDINIGIFL
jgi:hypothetical protein